MNLSCVEKVERRKNPQEKKRDEYDKGMRPSIENPHAFRKNWPKKKARINRRKRKNIKSAIRRALSAGVVEIPSPQLLKATQPLQQVKKQGIQSLREYVRANLDWRENLQAEPPAATERNDSRASK